MSLLIAIPGQPVDFRQVPAGEVERAIEAVNALGRSIAAETFLGFLQPPLRAQHCREVFTACCDASLTRRRAYSCSVECRWGVLWTSDDWYEIGWHPSAQFMALEERRRQQLWDALNPGKRPSA